MHTQLAAELGKCSDVRFALEPIDEHDIGPNIRKRADLSAAARARVPCECIASTGAMAGMISSLVRAGALLMIPNVPYKRPVKVQRH